MFKRLKSHHLDSLLCHRSKPRNTNTVAGYQHYSATALPMLTQLANILIPITLRLSPQSTDRVKEIVFPDHKSTTTEWMPGRRSRQTYGCSTRRRNQASAFHGEKIYLRPNLFCFFSAGFKIWKEQSRLSSTLIMAPALSNSPQ